MSAEWATTQGGGGVPKREADVAHGGEVDGHELTGHPEHHLAHTVHGNDDASSWGQKKTLGDGGGVQEKQEQ
jgi:hypothetical protein